MASPVRLLLISGSTRAASTNAAALRVANALGDETITTVLYDGLAELPAFNPDDEADALPQVVSDLRAHIAAADGVLFCTPEYAGYLPGSLKNLLDWTVGGGEMYGKPSTWLNVALTGRGGAADDGLRIVLGYVGADISDAAATRIPVERADVSPAGEITAPAVRAAVERFVRDFAQSLG